MQIQLTQGGKNNVAAGTALPVTVLTTKFVTRWIIQAKQGNTGKIYLGVNGVAATGCVRALSAGESYEWTAPVVMGVPVQFNFGQLYFDATVSGEGILFGYFEIVPT